MGLRVSPRKLDKNYISKGNLLAHDKEYTHCVRLDRVNMQKSQKNSGQTERLAKMHSKKWARRKNARSSPESGESKLTISDTHTFYVSLHTYLTLLLCFKSKVCKFN